MRLNKYLAASGIASRRKSETVIRSGRVKVNGTSVTDPFYLLQPDDVVSVDSHQVSLAPETVVVALNKPKGVITTVADTHGRNTVMKLVQVDQRLFPIGRLDKDTTGVLLLTNNGDLAHRLSHPKFEVEKIYSVIVKGSLAAEDIRKIESGIDIGHSEKGMGTILASRVRKSGHKSEVETEVRLALSHGKKREVRRIFAALSYPVLALHRESFAGVDSEPMAPGEWRQLSRGEIQQLMKE